MITIKKEISLYNFQAWSGGKDTLNNIIEADKIDMLEDLLNDCFEVLTDTQLNDILWFDDQWLYEQLGMEEYLD